MLCLGLLMAGLAAQSLSPATSVAPTSPLPAAAIEHGEQLFSGQVRLANRGPACIACHSAGGLAFPNGGTLGPDLTHVVARMGPEGVRSALETLYFPAMVPLYRNRPLTPVERQDIAAFLQSANTAAAPSDTSQVAGLAGLIFVCFMLIAAWTGRTRLRGVRRRLLERARAVAGAPAITERGPE
jgi:mono/diheme cytochrome c family protein